MRFAKKGKKKENRVTRKCLLVKIVDPPYKYVIVVEPFLMKLILWWILEDTHYVFLVKSMSSEPEGLPGHAPGLL